MQNGNGATSPLLIDTHYWLWLTAASRDRLTEQNLTTIRAAASAANLLLSAISVWEVAMLESKGRIKLFKQCALWVEEGLAMPGLTLAPLSPAIAIESNHLPGEFHGDPADRIIVATARITGARLLTADQNIRAYAQQQYVLLA